MLRQASYPVDPTRSFLEEGKRKHCEGKHLLFRAFIYVFLYYNYTNNNVNVVCAISINTFFRTKESFCSPFPSCLCVLDFLNEITYL